MIGILVVSHEPFGTALIRCTRHIYGRMLPQLAALDVIPDEDPAHAIKGARELALRINDGSGIVVLTDVFGATPSRIAMAIAEPGRIEVLTGINLPMLLKALTCRRLPIDEMIESLVESGRRAMFRVEVSPSVPHTGTPAQSSAVSMSPMSASPLSATICPSRDKGFPSAAPSDVLTQHSSHHVP